MKKVERKYKIKTLINQKGQVTIEELAKNFNVTEETIRRDLKSLDNEHEIKKVHGGALSLKSNKEDALHERFYQNSKEKEIIANKAIQVITPNSKIYIDFGSTTLAFCSELNKVNNLTIFTNSPLIARRVLEVNSSHTVYILGGQYLANLHQNIGYVTIDAIRKEFVDLAITSAAAINLKHGFFNVNEDERQIAQAMMENSRQYMILADNSKVKKEGTWKICSFKDVDFLISESKDSEMENICKKYFIEYI